MTTTTGAALMSSAEVLATVQVCTMSPDGVAVTWAAGDKVLPAGTKLYAHAAPILHSPSACVDTPELLEALEKLLSSCDDSDAAQYGTLGTSFVRSIAEAAIAKATKSKSLPTSLGAAELAAPISVGRQEVQKTHPALPAFYQTRINFGGSENPGNTVALVFGNNSTSASEQLAFAEKLVRCYNQDAAVSAMAEREAETSRALTASLNVVKRLQAERDALRDEVEALRDLLAENVHLKFELSASKREVEALRADAERLNWLDANNIPKRLGWKVGTAPAGNVSVSSVLSLGPEPVTIRAAIDAARAEARDV